MRRIHARCLALGLSCLFIPACAALEPKADPSRFFTLTSVGQLDQSRFQGSFNGGDLFIGIGPVKLPGYLDREQLVTRVSQNRFQIAENDRWAEPLEANFTRVLTQNLTARLTTGRFVIFPWRPGERPAYQLEIDVLRFERHASGSVELIARWIVRGATLKSALANETRLTLAVRDSSTEAAVAALSGALGEFSDEIAQALQGLAANAKL